MPQNMHSMHSIQTEMNPSVGHMNEIEWATSSLKTNLILIKQMTKCDSNSVIMKACEINACDNCSSMLYCQRYGDGYGNCHLWNVILIKEHQNCHKPVIWM
jgi:hypothetical protein